MMKQSSEHISTVDDQEVTHKADLVDNGVEGSPRKSFGSSTLESNTSSDEDHTAHSKISRVVGKRKIRKLLLSVLSGFLILGLGYLTGWVVGERRRNSNLSVHESDPLDTSLFEPDPFEPSTPSPVGNSMTTPSITTSFPISEDGESHYEDPMTSTGSSSKSPVEWNIELPDYIPPRRPETAPPIPLRVTQPPTTKTSPPTRLPMTPPSMAPTDRPTRLPVTPPSMTPTDQPTRAPIKVSTDTLPVAKKVTYIPGKLTRLQNNLLLSEGLEARIIAESGKPVKYSGGESSDINFHTLPDGGAAFPDTRWWNTDGWIYVSNSEAKNETKGGAGAITFDKHGSVLHYHMVLENTYMNCGGGRTPWNTWVSCEEVEFTGQIYQVDPTGQRRAQKTTIGSAGGRWESFAYDIRDKSKPRFFSTEDHKKGATRRFTPSVTHWGGDEWKMLHEAGDIHYLFVNPNHEKTGGTFEWTNDLNAAKNNARSFYPQSEGIDIKDGKMYIVCKKIKQLFVFDLDQMTYKNVSTASGLFDGGPDQMQRIIGGEGGLLYFTEEGGVDAGVHARDELGRFFTILESPVFLAETTGLSFSPDKKHMYVAYQENGILFDVTREDGLAFDGESLDVKYHDSISSRRLNSQWVGI